MLSCVEKRRAERFTGAVQVELQQGRGLTRDFSADGVYFETDQLLSVGEQLDFVMNLIHSAPAPQLRLHCRGNVLRVEPGVEKTGVAVAITAHKFERTQCWIDHEGAMTP